MPNLFVRRGLAPTLVNTRGLTSEGGRMLKREPTFGTPVTGPLGRAADRRRSAATLLAAVASGPSLVRDPRGARERLEEELRHALQARSVMLRDDPVTLMPPPPNASCFEVPLSATDARARLEAVFDTP